MKNFWRKNKWQMLGFSVFLFLGLFLMFKGASADSLLDKIGQQEGVPKTDLPTLVGNIIKVILGILGIVLVVLIIWSGIMWMTAGGDSGKVTKAKDNLFNAIVGLAIVVAAYALANFVVTQLNKAVGEGSSGGSSLYLYYPLLK